jgi:hypothetical protein
MDKQPRDTYRTVGGAMEAYVGLTYPHWLIRWKWQRRLWRRFMCSRRRHLFDEVATSGGVPYHYLNCDACQMMVAIADFDFTYAPDLLKKYQEEIANDV